MADTATDIYEDRPLSLPSNVETAAPVIEAYHETVKEQTGRTRYGWTLAEHLYKGTPEMAIDDSWADVIRLAKELDWGERGEDGELAPDDEDLLRGAWHAYRGYLQMVHLAAKVDGTKG